MKVATTRTPTVSTPTPSVSTRPRAAEGEAAAGRGHDFARMSVLPGGKRGESFPGVDDENVPGMKRTAGDAGVDGGTAGGAADAGPTDAGAAAQASLTASGDSYTDTASESHKKIKFSVSVPSGQNVKDFGLVNWVKGSMKSGSGAYFKAKMYGSWVDANYASYQVDSVDADPLYWSDASARWNYTTESGGFSATDDPGPALKTETGAIYALKFRMSLYKFADLPATTSGSIAATAIQSVDWNYSVKVSSTGAFSHPAL